MLYISLILALLAGSTAGQFKTTCPPKEGIAKCTCTLRNTPELLCSGFQSLSELQVVSSYMKGYSFSKVSINGGKLDRLPSDIFQGSSIRSLRISFTTISALGSGVNRPAFVGLENSLEELEITDVFIDNTKPMLTMALPHLKKLTSLKIANNVIPAIGNDWFQSGPYSLQEVHFYTSDTKKLGSHAFAFLPNVKKISVTGGSISELNRSMFPKSAPRLVALDFSFNALTTLPEDIFNSMPALNEVSLQTNGFTEIDELAWSSVWNQMEQVYFYGNPVDCNENIKWIYKYRLPGIFEGECVSPTKLSHKLLEKLTLRDFN